MLPFTVRVDLRAKVMKGYRTFPELMLFCIISKKFLKFRWEGSDSSEGDAVCVFLAVTTAQFDIKRKKERKKERKNYVKKERKKKERKKEKEKRKKELC